MTSKKAIGKLRQPSEPEAAEVNQLATELEIAGNKLSVALNELRLKCNAPVNAALNPNTNKWQDPQGRQIGGGTVISPTDEIVIPAVKNIVTRKKAGRKAPSKARRRG